MCARVDYFTLPPEWVEHPNFRKSAMANASMAGFLARVDKRFTWLAGWVLGLPAYVIIFCFCGKGDERLFALCHAWVGLTGGGVHYLRRRRVCAALAGDATRELVVGVEIVQEVKAKKQQFPNPMSESDDGISDE